MMHHNKPLLPDAPAPRRFAVLAMLAFLPPYLGVAVAATGASPGKALRAQVSLFIKPKRLYQP